MSLLDDAVGLARAAGAELATTYGTLRRADADRKGGASRDLVSEADRASERLIVAGIPAADDVIGEEGAARETGAARKWIVDPLDGTVNYLHGLPFWCVSIAVAEAGELVAGVVHAPALGKTFTAAKGEGAFVDGEAIRVSETATLGEAILATGFAYRRNELPDHNFDNFEKLGMQAAGVRRMGSAALDLCFLAAGALDGFWEMHLQPWDVAAGALIVREAGGKVTDFHGEESLRLLFGKHVVAANPALHPRLREELAPLRGLA